MKKVKANIYGADTDPKKGVNNDYECKPNAIQMPCLMMAVGVRNSGKSYAVSKIVAQAMKDSVFDKIYIVTPTMLSNMSYFGRWIQDEDVFEPTADSIQKVLERGEEMRDKWEQFCQELKDYNEYMDTLKGKNDFTDDQLFRFDELGFLDGIPDRPKWCFKKERPPQSLMILDDVLGSKSLSLSSGLQKCSTLNRHLFPINPEYVGNGRTACGLSVIICAQKYRCQGFSLTTLRENLTHLLLVGPQKQPKQLEVLTEELGGGINPEQFHIAYAEASKKKYGNLLIDFFAPCKTKTYRQDLNTYLVFPEDEKDCECKKKPKQMKRVPVEEKKEDKEDKTSV